jgi:hypothetical protein
MQLSFKIGHVRRENLAGSSRQEMVTDVISPPVRHQEIYNAVLLYWGYQRSGKTGHH